MGNSKIELFDVAYRV